MEQIGYNILWRLVERSPLGFILTIIILCILFALVIFYLAYKTMVLDKDMTGMGDILNREGEVTQSSESIRGTQGWIFVFGENWYFHSRNKLKVGDIVKVTSYKGIKLEVEKIEEVL